MEKLWVWPFQVISQFSVLYVNYSLYTLSLSCFTCPKASYTQFWIVQLVFISLIVGLIFNVKSMRFRTQGDMWVNVHIQPYPVEAINKTQPCIFSCLFSLGDCNIWIFSLGVFCFVLQLFRLHYSFVIGTHSKYGLIASRWDSDKDECSLTLTGVAFICCCILIVDGSICSTCTLFCFT